MLIPTSRKFSQNNFKNFSFSYTLIPNRKMKKLAPKNWYINQFLTVWNQNIKFNFKNTWLRKSKLKFLWEHCCEGERDESKRRGESDSIVFSCKKKKIEKKKRLFTLFLLSIGFKFWFYSFNFSYHVRKRTNFCIIHCS